MGLITGLISGLMASFTFWLYLRKMRPRISIAPFVLIYKPNIHRNFYTYCIRIINETRHSLLDLRFHIRLRKELPTHRISITVPLQREKVFSLAPKEGYDITFYIENNEELKKQLSQVFSSDIKLQKILKDGFNLYRLLDYFEYLEFNLHVTHPTSSVSEVFTIRYRKENLIHGRFLKRDSLRYEEIKS